MILRDYLYFNRIRVNNFAKMIDCVPGHLSQYMTGNNRLSKKLAKKIEEVTGGQVTISDIMDNNPTSCKRFCPHCKHPLTKKYYNDEDPKN